MTSPPIDPLTSSCSPPCFFSLPPSLLPRGAGSPSLVGSFDPSRLPSRAGIRENGPLSVFLRGECPLGLKFESLRHLWLMALKIWGCSRERWSFGEFVRVGEMEGRMQGKAQFSDSNWRITEADAPPRRVYQAWKGSNILAILLLTSGRDPGIVPRNAHPSEPEDIGESSNLSDWPGGQHGSTGLPLTKDVLVNGVLVKVKYCHTCMLYRPPRCSIAQSATTVLNTSITIALG